MQAVVDRLPDIDEILTYSRRTKPDAAAPGQGALRQPGPLSLNERAAAQQHSDFGVSRKDGWELTDGVAPALGQHVRPTTTRGRGEPPACYKFNCGVPLQAHLDTQSD